MRVLVTRPTAEAQAWVDTLRARGFDALALPLIDIRPPSQPADLGAAWDRMDGFRAVMFVSANAVREFFAQRPPASEWPQGTRAWATGAGTRGALLRAGLSDAQVDSPPREAARFDSESLWAQVAGQVNRGDRILVVRGGDASDGKASGRDWLADQLRAAGAKVDTVVAYLRALPVLTPAQRREALAGANGAVWLFSSSQAIANLGILLPGQDWSYARAIATHPRIAQAARAASFGVVCESRPPMEAVVAALESFR